jgi:hypothetical protein
MIVKDETAGLEALAIVEKYETFVRYLYPILQRAPRRHGVLRDVVLAALFVPIGDLHHAAKSRQVSRLHAVDAEFATLRAHLRFLAEAGIRIVTPRQHASALALLAEPGRMLGAWQRKLKAPAPRGTGQGQAGQLCRARLSSAARGGTATTPGRATRTSPTTGPRTRTRTSGRAAAVTTGFRRGGDHGPAGRPRRAGSAGRGTIKVGGQPACPASANTLHGPA